jgi:TRAP-type C4-dicarboxylate transport system permease small subunit
MKIIEIIHIKKIENKQIIKIFLKIYILAMIGLMTINSYLYVSDLYFDYGFRWYYTTEYLEVIAEYSLEIVFLLTFLKFLNAIIEVIESMER